MRVNAATSLRAVSQLFLIVYIINIFIAGAEGDGIGLIFSLVAIAWIIFVIKVINDYIKLKGGQSG